MTPSTFIIRRSKERKFFEEPHYEFKPKKFVFLANLCWKFLNRISSVHHILSESYDTFTFTKYHQDKLDEFIFKNANNILDICDYIKPHDLIIYIGQKQFSELMSLKSSASLMSFNLKANGHIDGTYHNFPVKIVPWLDGVVILPKI